jgi:phosphohistidine phosphatase
LFISSPATRALETAQIFTDMLGIPENKLITEEKVYDASSGIFFLDLLKNIDNKHQIICLVGHEPTLSDFALFLLKDFKDGIPKSGVVGIEFDITSWKNVSPSNARHKFNLYPDDNVKAKNIKKKELQSKISIQIKKVLSKLDDNTMEEVIELIDKSSEKIARKFLKKLKKYRKNNI